MFYCLVYNQISTKKGRATNQNKPIHAHLYGLPHWIICIPHSFFPQTGQRSTKLTDAWPKLNQLAIISTANGPRTIFGETETPLKLRGEKQSLRINPTTKRVVNNTVFLIGTAVDSSSDGIRQAAIVTPLDITAPVSLSHVFTASTKLLVKVFRYITESFGEITATQWSLKARPYVKLIRKTPSPRLTLSIKMFLLAIKYALDVQRRISKEVVFH